MRTPKLIHVIVVRVGHPPVVETIPDTLEASQKIVGGDIESLTLPHALLGARAICVVNEDGVRKGLPHNGCGLLGDFFFCRLNGAGYYTSLTDVDVTSLTDYVNKHRQVRHPSLDTPTLFRFSARVLSYTDFVASGGKWLPSLTWSGDLRDADEIRAVQRVLSLHEPSIVCYGVTVAPAFSMYVLELMVKPGDATIKAAYAALFDRAGKLKREHRKP